MRVPYMRHPPCRTYEPGVQRCMLHPGASCADSGMLQHMSSCCQRVVAVQAAQRQGVQGTDPDCPTAHLFTITAPARRHAVLIRHLC